MTVELRPHQVKAVNELANGKILRADPGTGKSLTGLAYFYIKECGGTLNDWGSLRKPRDLYIITTAKKRNDGDWQRDAHKLGFDDDREISAGGIKVTVDSWNNIEKYKEVKDAFFIFDEQKVVGLGVWAKTFIKIARANRWILLTATPGDTWLDYAQVFIANGFYKNITEFKHTHVVYKSWTKYPAVERYIGIPRLVRNQNAILVEMPYERHTTRHVNWLEVDHDEQLLEKVTKKRWHVYEERPLRDVAELFSVARKVVNSDASRLTQLRKIQAKHKRVIVFYNFDYELEILRTFAQTLSHNHPDGKAQVLSGTSLSRGSTGPEKTVLDTSAANLPISGLSMFGEDPGDFSTETKSSRAERKTASLSSTTIPALSKDRPGLTQEAGRTLRGSTSTETLLSGWTVLTMDRETWKIRRELTPPPAPSPDWTPPIPPSTSNSHEERSQDESGSLPSWFTSSTKKTEVDSTSKLGGRSTGSMEGEGRPGSTSSQAPIRRVPLSTYLRDRSTSTSPPHSPTTESISKLQNEASVPGGRRVVVAEWNGHKHEAVPTSDEWIYLVQYRAGAEAWNCTTTDATVFWSMTYSYKDFEQSQGRIDRMNTLYDDLWYYVFYSDSWIDLAVRKSLLEKHDFNEKRYEKSVQVATDMVNDMAQIFGFDTDEEVKWNVAA